ncbi:hypothetical protein BJX66DRAFT_110546 [Aspergillus keveii]|uniref:CUB domain-containing protein n=1 Tax=Aspergillus keveii TaxID=714993 RepID=A0ABR4FKZ8_9EURO
MRVESCVTVWIVTGSFHPPHRTEYQDGLCRYSLDFRAVLRHARLPLPFSGMGFFIRTWPLGKVVELRSSEYIYEYNSHTFSIIDSWYSVSSSINYSSNLHSISGARNYYSGEYSSGQFATHLGTQNRRPSYCGISLITPKATEVTGGLEWGGSSHPRCAGHLPPGAASTVQTRISIVLSDHGS